MDFVDFVAFDHVLKQLCKNKTMLHQHQCNTAIILFQHCVPTGEISSVKVLDKNVMNTFYKLS